MVLLTESWGFWQGDVKVAKWEGLVESRGPAHWCRRRLKWGSISVSLPSVHIVVCQRGVLMLRLIGGSSRVDSKNVIMCPMCSEQQRARLTLKISQLRYRGYLFDT